MEPVLVTWQGWMLIAALPPGCLLMMLTPSLACANLRSLCHKPVEDFSSVQKLRIGQSTESK